MANAAEPRIPCIICGAVGNAEGQTSGWCLSCEGCPGLKELIAEGANWNEPRWLSYFAKVIRYTSRELEDSIERNGFDSSSVRELRDLLDSRTR